MKATKGGKKKKKESRSRLHDNGRSLGRPVRHCYDDGDVRGNQLDLSLVYIGSLSAPPNVVEFILAEFADVHSNGRRRIM